MDLHFTWRILYLGLWNLGWADVLCQVDGAVPHLSKKDVLLLADDDDPKCFTRTKYDFTCFWEEPGNNSYDFFYKSDDREKRCNLTLQRTGEGTVLHVCSFPASDVFLFTLTHIRVVETSTNNTLYTRSVSVEDLGLLDPPVNVSLHPTGHAGQLRVAWHALKDWENSVQYGIRYSSQSLRERTELVKPGRSLLHSLASLVPGEEVNVQMRVKHSGYSDTETIGHWSHWSAPVSTMVPQSAADISLLCHTSDLQNVTCQWDDQADSDPTYRLFYNMGSSSGEEEGWRECLQDKKTSHSCCFHGDESRVTWVKLSAGPGALSRTFYIEPLTLNNSIRTAPPGRLRGESEVGRLSLRWDAPLLALSAHLLYQVRYQPRGEGVWKLVTLQGPETGTCLDVKTGSQYSIQVRAKPDGSSYAGYWSDWSHDLIVAVPSDLGTLLLLWIPLMLLIVSVVFISMFSRYFSKLKQYLWPPVPNLDKVLQGFLTEINRQTWDPPFNVKQCSEETPASMVEIMSEEDPDRGKPLGESCLLLSLERGSNGGEQQEEETPGIGLEISQDYVSLNTDDVIPCLRGNEYVYKGAEPGSLVVGGQHVLQMRCHCSITSRSSSFPSSSTTTTTNDILNRSYQLLAEPTERLDGQGTRGATGNLYANLENIASAN